MQQQKPTPTPWPNWQAPVSTRLLADHHGARGQQKSWCAEGNPDKPPPPAKPTRGASFRLAPRRPAAPAAGTTMARGGWSLLLAVYSRARNYEFLRGVPCAFRVAIRSVYARFTHYARFTRCLHALYVRVGSVYIRISIRVRGDNSSYCKFFFCKTRAKKGLKPALQKKRVRRKKNLDSR